MRSVVAVCVLMLAFQVAGGSGESGGEKTPAQIPSWSVNGGGNVHSGSGSYRLSSSVGQSIAGKASGASHVMYAGFWNPGIISVGVEEELIEELPRVHALLQNYPNPFNRSTAIRYAIPKSEAVKIEVYNIAGQCVRVLVNGLASPGYRVVNWDGRNESGVEMGCGVYFYRISTPEYGATKKMLLLK